MAGQGKEKKRDDSSRKDEVRKDDASRESVKKDEVMTLLRQLTEQVAMIRADVDDIQAVKSPSNSNSTTKAKISTGIDDISINDTEVARLGYALSSPQKVALIRLLHTGGEQSAAQLGEQAGLTTGSLYHHLRELIHADVLTQETRNRYSLSERGRQAVLALASLTTG